MYHNVRNIKNHRLYPAYLQIRSRLSRHQFVCWIAGGAVRDAWIGREFSEFDLVTDACTDVLIRLFPEAIRVGESFGVLKIPFDVDGKIEVFDLATFREESDYADGRRPSAVISSTPTQDAKRRDFTVNSLYWDPCFEVVRDYMGGEPDLHNQRLKTVGDAEIRFSEDYLRILRLVRFCVQLGFSIEETTLNQAQASKARVLQVSPERIWSEFKKIESSNAIAAAFRLPLFVDILELVLDTETNVESRQILQREASWTWAIAFYLIAPHSDLHKVLKSKLRLSNQILSTYQHVRQLMGLREANEHDIFYILDREGEGLLFVLRDLVRTGLYAEDVLKRFEDLIRKYPTPIKLSLEVIQLVPAESRREVLREIRLLQWSGRLSTSPEAEQFLKKKYANLSVKP